MTRPLRTLLLSLGLILALVPGLACCSLHLHFPSSTILPLPDITAQPGMTLDEVFFPCEVARVPMDQMSIIRNPEIYFTAARCMGYRVLHHQYPRQNSGYEDPELAALMNDEEPAPNNYARYEDALYGAELAERTAELDSSYGLAHYVAAYLVGLAAENNPYEGLDLVPRMEESALEAARLSPRLDHGGPDRMLGELYLRAPEFPTSIGDTELAVEHYARAVSIAPRFAENRLGYARALLADGDQEAACRTYRELIDSGADLAPFIDWADDLILLEERCASS